MRITQHGVVKDMDYNMANVYLSGCAYNATCMADKHMKNTDGSAPLLSRI